MLIRILICLILLIIGHSLVAQTRPTEDTQEEPAPKKVSHYIGLQANQLIRQLISFGGNSSPVNNPYTLVYSVNSNTTGIGFTTGLGFLAQDSKTTDQFNSVTTKTNDFAWRFGIDKKTYLSKNWLIGFGGDILIESSKSETTSRGGGSAVTTITTESKRSGFGPRVTLSYQFHKRLLLGTEGAYYFRWIKQEQTNVGTGQPNDPSTDLKSFGFTIPAVLFITLKI